MCGNTMMSRRGRSGTVRTGGLFPAGSFLSSLRKNIGRLPPRVSCLAACPPSVARRIGEVSRRSARGSSECFNRRDGHCDSLCAAWTEVGGFLPRSTSPGAVFGPLPQARGAARRVALRGRAAAVPLRSPPGARCGGRDHGAAEPAGTDHASALHLLAPRCRNEIGWGRKEALLWNLDRSSS